MNTCKLSHLEGQWKNPREENNSIKKREGERQRERERERKREKERERERERNWISNPFFQIQRQCWRQIGSTSV
jgi:hypothetical protein